MTETELLIAVGIWIVCGIGAYLIAAQKGSDQGLMGFLFGPIGLLMAVTAKSGAAWTGSRCGKCGKPLSPAWKTKCNHCGATFAEFPPS
jgi:hypothetical protein